MSVLLFPYNPRCTKDFSPRFLVFIREGCTPLHHGTNSKAYFERCRILSTYSGRILGHFSPPTIHITEPLVSAYIKYVFPPTRHTTSKDRSNPKLESHSVTERTPITIPNAVKIDLVLFAKTAPKDILRFSK